MHGKAKFKPSSLCPEPIPLNHKAVLPPSCQGRIELSWHQCVCLELLMFTNKGKIDSPFNGYFNGR